MQAREVQSEEGVLEEAASMRRLLGTTDFHVSFEEMTVLLGHVLPRATRPRVSLNRPQAGGGRLVHTLEWMGMRFTAVSARPILVS